MANWPLPDGPQLAEVGTLVTSFPPAVTVTASGTTNTKGAWQEVVAATGQEWDGFTILFDTTAANGVFSAVLLDVGIGGAGSEVTILANFQIGWMCAGGTAVMPLAHQRFIPLQVPAGSRIAYRIQSATASKAVSMSILGHYGGGFDADGGAAIATTYGANTAASTGVNVVGDVTTANAFTAWQTLSASITAAIDAMLVTISGPSNTLQVRKAVVQIAVGSAGNEQVIAEVYLASQTNEFIVISNALGVIVPLQGLNIAAGQRLSARIAVDTTTTNTFSVTAVGFTYC